MNGTRLRWRAALAMVSAVTVLGVGGLQSPAVAAEGSWAPTGSLQVPRQQATATLLEGGKVLVSGGRNFAPNASHKSAELYDPIAGTFGLTGAMANGRWSHTATRLPTGKVLVTGGFTDPTSGANAQPVLDAAEIYDPATGTWSPTGSMGTRRALHVAQLLPNGKVLVSGGRTCSGPPPTACNFMFVTKTAEIYDPATGAWSPTGSMNQERHTTSAVLLASGKVLVPAGFPGGQNTADLYDPSTGTWANTGTLNVVRARQGAMLLANGQALVAAGSTGSATATSEIYNPATDTWTLAGNVARVRFNYFFTELPNGKVLIVGGANAAATTSEVFDPATRAWSDAGTLPSPHGSGSSLGNSTRAVVLSADPRSFTFDPRVCGSNCGKVLLVGDNAAGAAELYTPANVSLAVCSTTVTGASGPVVAPAGQVTCLTGATVTGAVTVQPGGALVVTNSNISGGIVSKGAAGMRICGSTVSSPRGVPAISVNNSFGPVVVGDGTPACPPNDIQRNVTLDANQFVEIDRNRVLGSVSVTWTAGTPGGPVIASNQITESLGCTNNTPPPTNEGRPNIVFVARTGQCAGL